MSNSPFTVLVAYDTEETGTFAFAEALRITRRVPASDVHIVHVAPKGTTLMEMHDLALAIRDRAVHQTSEVEHDEDRVTEIHLRAGDPAREIADVVKEIGADVVVVGSGPWHLRSLWRGSSFAQIQRVVRCPIMVARVRPEALITIEPPCPACVAVRERTNGRLYWCGHHAEHHIHAHPFGSPRTGSFSQHDSEVVPTGVDFS